MPEPTITPTERDAQLVLGYARIEVELGLDGRVPDDFASGLTDEALLACVRDYHAKTTWWLLSLAGVTREALRRNVLREAQRAAEGEDG